MKFFLSFTISADGQMKKLKHLPHLKKRYKAVIKALGYLINNPRHPGLYTHEYTSLKGPTGGKIFEAYAEQNTPGAYRIFFYYGKIKGEIVITAIIPHP
jgi:hypothetical protein